VRAEARFLQFPLKQKPGEPQVRRHPSRRPDYVQQNVSFIPAVTYPTDKLAVNLLK